MAAPKPLAQVWELGQEPRGAFALPLLDQAADRDLRRDRDHDMDVIRRNMPLQDIDSKLATVFPDNRPDTFGHFAASGLVAIFGDPDDMEVDRKGRMRAMAIVTHAPQSTANPLKLPPKGVGFAPPNWRQ
jgi:hypothetical protein